MEERADLWPQSSADSPCAPSSATPATSDSFRVHRPLAEAVSSRAWGQGPGCPLMKHRLLQIGSGVPAFASEGAGRVTPGWQSFLWTLPAQHPALPTHAKELRTGPGPRGPGSGVPGPDAPAMTSSPVSRVVYNGKRNSSPRSPTNSSEIFTPAHEENVRFIYEAWQGVERDLRNQLSGSERGLVEEYVEKAPNPSLKTFKPIDLSDLRRRSTQDTKKS
ncbi:mapk-regulated corepressor-interacting protein 1 isoform X6 [Elephas maximus indicus]|uniref:mapk-regulated corepressor-interacting protein 1 isoform X6 n=1 Tax=Elephas maximus indicus TaxID=99487 RepID=UPI002115FAD1|nr:mapk-regulated corepressor-interacting protein 1 isoform X6 [Elephas maximus indicus]